MSYSPFQFSSKMNKCSKIWSNAAVPEKTPNTFIFFGLATDAFLLTFLQQWIPFFIQTKTKKYSIDSAQHLRLYCTLWYCMSWIFVGLALTPDGYLVTLDTTRNNPKVFVLSQDGSRVDSFPFAHLCNPKAPGSSKCRFLAVQAERLIVSDLGVCKSCVIKFISMSFFWLEWVKAV